jgi:hypothetical protein
MIYCLSKTTDPTRYGIFYVRIYTRNVVALGVSHLLIAKKGKRAVYLLDWISIKWSGNIISSVYGIVFFLFRRRL